MKRILLLILLLPFVYAQEPLFDIVVDIPQKYRIVSPGDEVLTNIKLVNLGSAGRIDIFLDYWIADENQNTIISKKETVAVETQVNFVRSFDIPVTTKPGKYKLHAKLTYFNGKEAASFHSFEVVRQQINKKFYYIAGIILAILLFLLLFNKIKLALKKELIKAKVYWIVRRKQG